MLHPERERVAGFASLRRLIASGSAFLNRLRSGRSQRLQRWLALALNGVLLTLLGLIIYQNRNDLPLIEQLLDLRIIGGSLLLYITSFLVQLVIWSDMMGYDRGERVDAMEDYIRTTFMGRLPGGLWKIVGRMTIYRAPRLTSRAILAVNLIEILLLLLANGALLLSLSTLPLWLRLAGLAALLLTLVTLATQSSRFIPALQQRHRPLRWLAWSAGYALAWLCGGLITYLILTPFSPPGALTFQNALSLWCISSAIGLLLQILPLSMLFRDATLVTLLRPLIPLQRAIVAAFAIRLLMMACELITGWGLIGLMRLLHQLGVHRKVAPIAPEDHQLL